MKPSHLFYSLSFAATLTGAVAIVVAEEPGADKAKDVAKDKKAPAAAAPAASAPTAPPSLQLSSTACTRSSLAR